MTKKIIFDIDGTLLKSDNDFLEAFDKYLKENKKGFISASALVEAIDDYELVGEIIDKKALVDYVNKRLNVNITINDFDNLLNFYYKEATLINENTKNILEYLSQKYELTVLSNWFIEGQKKRLKKAGIYSYFQEYYGIDNLGIKPNKWVFEKACYPYKLNECLIVGDNAKVDIKVPLEIGMQALHLNLESTESKYPSIKSLDELKNIL